MYMVHKGEISWWRDFQYVKQTVLNLPFPPLPPPPPLPCRRCCSCWGRCWLPCTRNKLISSKWNCFVYLIALNWVITLSVLTSDVFLKRGWIPFRIRNMLHDWPTPWRFPLRWACCWKYASPSSRSSSSSLQQAFWTILVFTSDLQGRSVIIFYLFSSTEVS